MSGYDPDTALATDEWLALGEDERIILVENYHRDARVTIPKSARRIHACIHVAVENQLAQQDDPVVRALARLMGEGLSRHDAVHAIGSVVAELVYDITKEQVTENTGRDRYYAAVERLSAESWREIQE
jgi:hypothetical protein